MCNADCILFCAINLRGEEITGKKVLEIGSSNVNGSIRPFVESFNPDQYIGIDIAEGKGVDLICDAHIINEKFDNESFDIVISTEMLEHVKDWRKVISNIKNVCKRGGIIILTTRSYGTSYHGHPYDFWRYEYEDMQEIFSDCSIDKLERDDFANGVFLRVSKPEDFKEKDLSDYELYCIINNKRSKEVSEETYRTIFYYKLVIKEFLKKILNKILKLFGVQS